MSKDFPIDLKQGKRLVLMGFFDIFKRKIPKEKSLSLSERDIPDKHQTQAGVAPPPTAKITFPSKISDFEQVYFYKDIKVAVSVPLPQDLIGREAKLVQEPDNEFDANAVALCVDAAKIGYLYKGKLQDMVNDFFKKDLPVMAFVAKSGNETEPPEIALAFYKKSKYLQLKEGDAPYKTIKLTGTAKREFQDTLEFCSIGDRVNIEFDYDRESYLASSNHDNIGYFPKSWNAKLDDSLDIFIKSLDYNDNDKLVVYVDVFFE